VTDQILALLAELFPGRNPTTTYSNVMLGLTGSTQEREERFLAHLQGQEDPMVGSLLGAIQPTAAEREPPAGGKRGGKTN
jgi:hypothetical protein